MSQDFRINAQVRALFVRLNVDLTKVEHGSTNGVIYVRGHLSKGIFEAYDDVGESRIAQAQFVHRIERALRRIPGVRDVVLNLERMVKIGTRWRAR